MTAAPLSTEAPVLAVDGLRKAFGETVALDGASLMLRRGEWLALLGPNGAGKTTLVRAIAGRVRPDGGALRLFGQALDGAAGAKRARAALGIVPQEIALYPLLTARENLDAFGGLHGVPARERVARTDAALAWTGLADRADEPVQRFSGGMKRRLNIACAVLHEPQVLLLDEPTVGVDPQSRERIWTMLRELQGRGVSLLHTTHQLDEAQEVCDRIVILDAGRSIADGTFEELLEQTVGRERRVVVHLEEPLAAVPDGFALEGDAALVRRVRDTAGELPAILAALGASGGRVRDLRIEAPTLQAVFIHLTGRALRE